MQQGYSVQQPQMKAAGTALKRKGKGSIYQIGKSPKIYVIQLKGKKYYER